MHNAYTQGDAVVFLTFFDILITISRQICRIYLENTGNSNECSVAPTQALHKKGKFAWKRRQYIEDYENSYYGTLCAPQYVKRRILMIRKLNGMHVVLCNNNEIHIVASV